MLLPALVLSLGTTNPVRDFHKGTESVLSVEQVMESHHHDGKACGAICCNGLGPTVILQLPVTQCQPDGSRVSDNHGQLYCVQKKYIFRLYS